jgi:hypothetical protein
MPEFQALLNWKHCGGDEGLLGHFQLRIVNIYFQAVIVPMLFRLLVGM